MQVGTNLRIFEKLRGHVCVSTVSISSVARISRISGITGIPWVANISKIPQMLVNDHVYPELAYVLAGQTVNMGTVNHLAYSVTAH
jgi:hypothetical protein